MKQENNLRYLRHKILDNRPLQRVNIPIENKFPVNNTDKIPFIPHELLCYYLYSHYFTYNLRYIIRYVGTKCSQL